MAAVRWARKTEISNFRIEMKSSDKQLVRRIEVSSGSEVSLGEPEFKKTKTQSYTGPPPRRTGPYEGKVKRECRSLTPKAGAG